VLSPQFSRRFPKRSPGDPEGSPWRLKNSLRNTEKEQGYRGLTACRAQVNESLSMLNAPTPTQKVPSEKQLNQRALLAMVSRWLTPIKALIWIGYQIFKGDKRPMNIAVAFHLKEAVTGNSAADYAIDFAKG
jgi:hypothetical protein